MGMKTSRTLTLQERPNPLNDYIFFRVMGEKGDEKQLLGFLNAVLGRPGKEKIKSVEILEKKTFSATTKDSKSCILDVLAVLSSGTKVNIEVQLSNKGNIDRRSLFYWGKVYIESLKKGQDYSELPNVVAINIVDFDFPEKGGFHTCFHIREDSERSLILSSALEIHCINMVQWRKQEGKDILKDPLHRWLAWFDESSPPELVEEVVNMDSAIAAAYEKLEEAMQDQDAYQMYWAERKFEHDQVSWKNYIRKEAWEEGKTEGIKIGLAEGKVKGLAEGKAKGLAEGKAKGLAEGKAKGLAEGKAKGLVEGKLEIAHKMKAAGLSLAEIMQFTGLSQDDI